MYSRIVSIILLTLFRPDAPAGELRLTPDAAVSRALSSNIHLRAAELAVRQAKVQLFWEGRLDNPVLELAAATDTFGRAEGEAVFEIAYVQKYPLTSRLRDAVELRRVEVALAEAEIGERRRALAREVRAACVELAVAEREAGLYGRMVELNTGITEFLEAAAKVGEASALDVAGTRLAGKVMERGGKAADAERMAWLAKLRPLLGLGADARLDIETSLALPDTAPAMRLPRQQMLARRPDYQAALVRGDVARAELALAKANGLEDLALKFFAERERSVDAPEGLEGTTMIGVGISIPLPIRKKNEAQIESAEIGIDRSNLEAEALGLEIESELAAALAARSAAYEAAQEASGEILELADANLRGFREAYGVGQAGFVQVQRAQEQKLEIEKTALDLAREYHLADAAVKHAAASDVKNQTVSK